MPMDNAGGLGGAGFTLGSTVSKVMKPKSPGSSIGRSVARTTKPKKKYSSGGGGSNRNSGGGNSNPRRVSIPENNGPKPGGKTGIPSLDAYLGTDSAYQNVVRGGKRSLADFISEIGRRRGEANTQFTQTGASMERDRVQQLQDLKDEYASRGLIQSGLFGEEQGKFQQQFTQQQTVMQQQQAALLADLLSQEKNFRREQDLALEAAKQEALQRRAAKYKIGA